MLGRMRGLRLCARFFHFETWWNVTAVAFDSPDLDYLFPPPEWTPCPIGHLGETFGSLTALTAYRSSHPIKNYA